MTQIWLAVKHCAFPKPRSQTVKRPSCGLYLCRLGYCLIQGCGPTFDLLFDSQVASLSLVVALCHCCSLLEAELGQLGPDLQQLVDVGLVLRYRLPQELEMQRQDTYRR